MAIYRGVGGSGDANNDAIISDVAEYSLAAQTAATNAANSATSASSSATSASGSASAASTSATNAASSASSASTSATNAANSATSAASSATSANSSKNAAALSETNAANSASAAATSEANAATSESNAASSETNAASSASAASTSATNAASSASSASTSATNASNSASSAAASASSASLSAANAATSETNAALSETNAATSEANALASETAAAASEAAAAALYDNFDDRYLGVKTTDPTLDNDGDALVTGALYFNSSTGVMMVYNGTGWQSLASGSASVTSFNGRTGTVTLTSTDVTDALTYTPLAPSAIGTTVQAYDADLTAFAAKTAPTGDVVGTTDTQTLTNKTISGSSNTLSNIGNSSLTNSSLTIGSTNISLGGTSTTLAGLTGVTVEANTSTDALRITQTGAGNALVVEDSANPDSTPFVIDINGKVIAGNTASTAMLGTGQPVIQVVSASGAVGLSTLGIGRWAAATSAPELWLSKSRGASVGANTIVNSGDNLGRFRFSGDDGNAFIEAASIDAQVDGTPGTNDMPGRLVFSTTADGASSPTERMRIDSTGAVGIGASSNPAYNLVIARNLSGGTTSNAVRVFTQVQSDVTSSAVAFQSILSTQATSFTLTALRHFTATQSTIGVGSTVANQYGFGVDSSLTGATNNYGFYSNIASGTGRWNFYAAGTANNYFAGETTVNSGLTIGRTAVTAPAASDGNVFSGTYTPTLTNTTNVGASTATVCHYMRVGDVVTVAGQVNFTATTANTDTELNMSLPIASNFSASRDCGGSGGCFSTGEFGENLAIVANIAADTAVFRGRPSVTTSQAYAFSFTYRVI